MSDRVGAVIQARMTSTRLPGKALFPLGGESVLCRVIRRVRQADLDFVGVATSHDLTDDAIAAWCDATDTPCLQGDLEDVLARYVGAAIRWELDHIVRITADCPMVNPDIIDMVVAHHLSTGADVTHNAAFPKGLDVQVVTRSALERVHLQASDPADREHVLTYPTKARGYHVESLIAPFPYHGPDVYLALDTPEDYERLKGWCT